MRHYYEYNLCSCIIIILYIYIGTSCIRYYNLFGKLLRMRVYTYYISTGVCTVEKDTRIRIEEKRVEGRCCGRGEEIVWAPGWRNETRRYRVLLLQVLTLTDESRLRSVNGLPPFPSASVYTHARTRPSGLL